MSGNKRQSWLYIVIALFIGACSPKTHAPVSRPVQPQNQPVSQPKTDQPEVNTTKPAVQKTSSIGLLLPFGLDNLSSSKGLSKSDQRKANLSIDYYQGFKLALDSLTAKGYNYRLTLYDSKDEPSQAHALAMNAGVRSNNLIVGPVFPEDVKAFATMPALQNKPIVSPLAPTPPSIYHNSGLITAAPPLEYHARTAAQYITRNLGAQKIFILSSGYSDENKYIAPFRKMADSLGRKRVQIINLKVVRGDLSSLLPQLSRTNANYFVVPSTNQAFLMVTLRSLDTLTQKYPVVLFGHPNWVKFSYLHADRLQRLKTHITSADRINYHAPEVNAFIRAYRSAYHHEPTEYAIKGFDEGLYFGEVLAADGNGLNHLNDFSFTGLHNGFSFQKKPGQGWVNVHVNLLKYVNFELKQVE